MLTKILGLEESLTYALTPRVGTKLMRGHPYLLDQMYAYHMQKYTRACVKHVCVCVEICVRVWKCVCAGVSSRSVGGELALTAHVSKHAIDLEWQGNGQPGRNYVTARASKICCKNLII